MKLFKNKKLAVNEQRHRPNLATSPKVVSYYTASRKQLDQFERQTSNKALKNRKRLFRKIEDKWFYILAGLVLAVAAGYLLTLNTTAIIKISGTNYRSAKEYQSVVNEVLSSDWKNRFKLSLDKAGIKNAIEGRLAEIEDMQITTNLLGHRPVVFITTYTVMAVFVQSGSENMLIGDRGRVLIPVENSNLKTLDLPLLQNLTGLKAKAGEQFMLPDEAYAFLRLAKQYEQAKAVVTYTLTAIPHELTVQESGRGYYVKYLLNEDIVRQFGALKATENKLSQLNQAPSEYIDVRLADKAYYK